MADSEDEIIIFRWIQNQVYAVLHPEMDPADAIYIKGKDLSALREWLSGELGTSLKYKVMPLRHDPANIYENLVLVFGRHGHGTASHKAACRDIMKLKLAVGAERNWVWETNFSDATT